jgi:NAD(P)-dependent dehydrogenase (short-subunit alcohol dehydrogenase family)
MDDGVAKAALVNLTKALSQEFGPRGIRINSLSPGPSRLTSGSARAV